MRKRFSAIAGFWTLLFGLPACVDGAPSKADSRLDVDFRAYASQANLIYERPAPKSNEGLPIGNGRMGTMLWTSPTALHMQLNRNDVFAVNKYHLGPQHGPTDYCSGVGSVEIDFGGVVFQKGASFRQHLSLYDAEATLRGERFTVRAFASAVTDVVVVEIDDQRAQPQPLRLKLSMWRPPRIETGRHVAAYQLKNEGRTVTVLQQFDEADYHCRSVVAATIVDPELKFSASGERSRTIVAPARRGKRLLLISSAASFRRQDAVDKRARAVLVRTSPRSYDDLRREHSKWWHRFWSRGAFVDLSSADGVAQFFSRLRVLYLYYVASTSRGLIPPKWNGLLFSTEGDARQWGAQFWVWTTQSWHWPLLAADAVELSDPFFNMYVRQLPDALKAGPQRWGVKAGAYYPETNPFDGPVVLPDDVADDFQEILYKRKKNTELSEHAHALCDYDGHLCQVATYEAGHGHISHITSSGSELAIHAWWRYRHTEDKEWLRTHAYPLLRGTVEFYRHFVTKEEDGLYHTKRTHVHEVHWFADDSIMDLAAIRGTAPLAIRASEILDVDAELREKWQDLLDKLAPYPMGSDERAQALHGGALAKDAWATGHSTGTATQAGNGGMWVAPMFPFEDWTLETQDPVTDAIARKTVELTPMLRGFIAGTLYGTTSYAPIASSRVGRGEFIPDLLTSFFVNYRPLPNGLSIFEGHQTQGIEHLGVTVHTLQESLLQANSPRPGQPEVIRVFPAWPKKWNASFRLLTRGAFRVASSIDAGDVLFVEIESRVGGLCRLRNPWGKPCRVVDAKGVSRDLAGDILRFETVVNGFYRVQPSDEKATTTARRIAPQAATKPVTFSYTLSNGRVVGETLGLANE